MFLAMPIIEIKHLIVSRKSAPNRRPAKALSRRLDSATLQLRPKGGVIQKPGRLAGKIDRRVSEENLLSMLKVEALRTDGGAHDRSTHC